MNTKITDFFLTEGSSRMRDNGRIELRLPYKDYTGKRRTKSFSGANLNECYAKAEDFFYEYNGLLCRPDSSIPDIIYAKLESDFKLNFIKEQTYFSRLSCANIIRKNGIGQIPITAVSKEMLLDYLGEITVYAPGTIEIVFIMLKQAFRIAADESLIPKNLMLSQDIRRPKSIKQAKKVLALTVEEQSKLECYLRKYKPPYGSYDHRNQIFIQLYTGLRIGEVNALAVKDIDLDAGVIHVRNTLINIYGKVRIGDTTKTYAGVRDVPISDKVIPYLESAIAAAIDNEHNLLFFDKKTQDVIAPYRTNSVFKGACLRCGIGNRSSHVLRHTFATRCIEAGVPAVVLKKWLGHTDIHITLDTYADVFDRMNDSAIAALDTYLGSLESNK